MPALVYDLIMQMRSGRLTAVACLAENVPPFYCHPFFNKNLAQVGVSCLIAEPVVDNHIVAVAASAFSYLFYDTVTCGLYRIAYRHREIQPGVHGTSSIDRIGTDSEPA